MATQISPTMTDQPSTTLSDISTIDTSTLSTTTSVSISTVVTTALDATVKALASGETSSSPKSSISILLVGLDYIFYVWTFFWSQL